MGRGRAGLDESSDADLAERALSGDRDAFGVLYDRYRRYVLACINRFGIRDAADAEDVLHRTFIKVLEAFIRGTYRDYGSLKAWIAVVARSACLDFVRGATRRDRLVSADDESEVAGVENDSAVLPEDEALKFLQAEVVRQCLERFSKRHPEKWPAMELRYEREETWTDIARKVGVPDTTLRQWYSRVFMPFVRECYSRSEREETAS